MVNYLEGLGFTPGEERVYMALLKIGSSTTGPIAKEANVSRSKLYEILEKLIKKGIVSHFEKNNVSQFQAAPPATIIDYLQKKEELVKKQRDEFEKKIPYFEAFLNNKELKKEAQVFEGMEGIKTIREAALKEMNSKQEMLYFGNSASGHENALGYWDDWNKRRIQKRINAKIIYNSDAREYGKRRKKQKYTKVKYLPDKGNTPAWIEIYGDVIAIVMKDQTPMSIVIHNKLVAESFKTYFKILWDISSSK